MGTFSEEITLFNLIDQGVAGRGLMPASDVRQVTVSALVDTGAFTLVIDEETRQRLGLAITGKRLTTFANGTQELSGLTEPVEVRWNERNSFCAAAVIPGAKTVLLGAIPLEDMDLKVNMAQQQLERAHGESWEALIL